MAAPAPSEWSAAYARIQRLADRDVLQLLQRAYRDINRMLAKLDGRNTLSDMVRIEQLQTVKRNLLRAQAEIFQNMGDIIRARRLEAAARATILGSSIDEAIFEAVGKGELAQKLRGSLTAGLNQTIDVAIARITISQVPLAERIYRTAVWMDGRLDRAINSALARGLSAREFAAEARSWFNPGTPGGTRYAALRLARTEINNAFHATSIVQAAEKPWIDNMQWHLSRSHPKPDECDAIAKGGKDGDGIYPPVDVPAKPHPQCFCFVTPISPDEDEFLDNLVSGKYDSYLIGKGASI